MLIHPSRGARDGRVNSKRSLEVYVDINGGAVGDALAAEQKRELLRRHPSGRIKFWGTYDHNRAKIARVREGDVVLFTGQGRVWAIGTVGFTFRSEPFAKSLWLEHSEKGSYEHVYSLSRFEEVDVPYAVVNEALGLNPRNHFQGMVVYEGARADAVVETLRLDVPESIEHTYQAIDTRLADVLANDPRTPLLAIEQSHISGAVAFTMDGDRLMRRGESLLVQSFAASLGENVRYGRRRTTAGMTDLEVHSASGHELIEAKSSVSTSSVRQVIAQLLHYAASANPVPDRVAGLFPEPPAKGLISVLHTYGIDVVYRVGAGEFRREAAPSSNRARLRGFWNGQEGATGIPAQGN